MVRHCIDALHSKYGPFLLEVERPVDNEVAFYFPSGNLMGSLDRECGGMLSHPHEDVSKFISTTLVYTDLCNLDPDGYVELEQLLQTEVKKFYPDFFKSEEPLQLHQFCKKWGTETPGMLIKLLIGHLPADIQASEVVKKASEMVTDLNQVLKAQPSYSSSLDADRERTNIRRQLWDLDP